MDLNTIILTSSKNGEVNPDEVRDALIKDYPNYKIAKLLEYEDRWEAHLECPLDKISTSVRISEFPFGKEDSGGDKEKSESKPKSEDSEEDSEESEESHEESDGDEDEFGGKPKMEKEESPLKSIEHLLKELTDKVKSLEEKANVVDDIHNTIKPHIEDAGGLENGPKGLGQPGMGMPSPEDIGPTAPSGGGIGGQPSSLTNPAGTGQKPPVPRRPYPSQGFDRRKAPSRGMPTAFTHTLHKVAFASMSEGTRKFSLTEAISALEETYPEYRVVEIKEDSEFNRYVGKLRIN